MKGVTGVWKDLLQPIIDKGDVGTVLNAIQSIPALARAEQNDPKVFWRRVFSKYFGEYIASMDIVEHFHFKKSPGFWRKITLWLTWAHRIILTELEETRGGDGFIVRTMVDGNATKDYTRVQLFGRLYTIPDFVRNVMKIESGQLLNMYDSLEEVIPRNQQELSAYATRTYWTEPFSFLFRMNPQGVFGHRISKDRIIFEGRIRNRGTPGGTVFLSIMMRKLSDYIAYLRMFYVAFSDLPDAPRSQNSQNPDAIYLGKCIMCSKEALYACGKCEQQYYCGQICAQTDWEHQHYKTCSK